MTWDLVKGLLEVKHHNISLGVSVQDDSQVVRCDQEMRFTGAMEHFSVETILALYEMVWETIMFCDFTADCH